MSEQDVTQRLTVEKEALVAELQDALKTIVFQHGKTIEAKMQKLIVKDDYGTEIYDKFYPERDYFIKTVMIRGIPADVWSFLFPEGVTPEKMFARHIGTYLGLDGAPSKPEAGASRPINEIVQQAEMLMSESDLLAHSNLNNVVNQDPLFEAAVQVILKSRKVSISLVQRNLKIGYNHAARLVEGMETNGIVSPMSATGQRDILNFSPTGHAPVIPFDGFNTDGQTDITIVRQMVEDHWRAFLLGGRQYPAIGADMVKAFDERIQAHAASMSPDKAGTFVSIVDSERNKLFSEYENSPTLLMQRLNIAQTGQPTQTSSRRGNRQGFGELVVRTAVRATVWEIVRSFFRR